MSGKVQTSRLQNGKGPNIMKTATISYGHIFGTMGGSYVTVRYRGKDLVTYTDDGSIQDLIPVAVNYCLFHQFDTIKFIKESD